MPRRPPGFRSETPLLHTRCTSHGPRALLGALVLSLLWLGCATPASLLPTAETRDPVIAEAMRRTEELYLWPDRIDHRMLVGALDALERPFDPVRFEEVDGAGVLWVGDARAEIPFPEEFDPEAFQSTLAAALLFTERNLPPDPNRDPEQTLELIALNGALSALDRYTTIFSGKETEDFRIRFQGKLRGIGARIGRRDGDLTAIKVFEDSPAERGGLLDGDAILSVDGNPTQALSVRDAVSFIRGEEGTKVVLHIRRDGKERDLEITRGEVVIPSVESTDLGDGIGHIKITTVSRTTLNEFRRKLRELGTLDGLVLDLRGNTGGSMLAAAQIADLFLSGDTIVRVIDKDGAPARGPRQRAVASRRVLVRAPVVVLVDGQTASAAEIISGAIEPLEHVTVVGQKTFGKGLIQRVVELPEANLLKLTVGEYLLSNDRAIHEIGVIPNIELFPVSTENLATLAITPSDAVPYLIAPDEENQFPVEFAKTLLRSGEAAAIREASEVAAERIGAELGERAQVADTSVEWRNVELDVNDGDELLGVRAQLATLVGGKASPLRLEVENTSDMTVPDAWLALGGSLPFLRNQITPLGTLEPGGRRQVDFELLPPDGLSAKAIPIDVRIAAGSRALQTTQLELTVENHPPQLEIVVERVDSDRARVTLSNLGCCAPGEVRVTVPGTIEQIAGLVGGDSRSVDIPLGGGARTVSIVLQGAGVRQRIDVPVPDDRVTVTPPQLEIERVSSLGGTQVRVSAKSTEGLQEGWLALDGQKAVYVAWNGAQDGALRSGLDAGDHDLTTKIKTLSGVSIIDSRRLLAD